MTVPDFSPGEVLTAAAMDSIGLWLVGSASATSGGTIVLDDVFSSTYDNYRVVVSNAAGSGATGLNMQLRAAGSTLGTSGYYNVRNGYFYSSGAISFAKDDNAAAWQIPIIISGTAAAVANVIMDIYSPAINTRNTGFTGQGFDGRTNGLGNMSGGGLYDATTAVDGISINSGAQTFSNIDIKVYGYRK
jgi:hypothetical protein